MAKYKVIVPLLNVRKAPVANFNEDNVITTVSKGLVLELEEVPNVPNPSLGKWYKDIHGQHYSEKGLQLLGGIAADITATSYPWWINYLEIPKIWTVNKGENVKIAILDTGYNVNIPDLNSAVKESKVFFSSVAGNPVTINDSYGHGTHCASLIGGRNIDNSTSCAPKSDLYIAKICSQGSVRSYSIIVDAIKWAIEKEVDIISISYGGESTNTELEEIINIAVNQHNIVVVASIGDVVPNSSNNPCYPALYKNCLAVGATNQSGKLSPINILNNKTEINAPGEGILGYASSSALENMSGTSQAAAIVSGICALIISKFKSINKNYTVMEIHELIKQNSNPVADNTTQRIISPTKIFSQLT
jgi:subtilisin family serine protease